MEAGSSTIALFPGLTKLKVKTFELRKKGFSPVVTLHVQAGDKEVELDFDYHDQPESTISKIKESIYIKDPSPMTAEWGTHVLKAIEEGKILIGMTKEQAKTSWGLPEKIRRSVGSWGVHEQWVYGDFGPYLYFENDILTSWQD